MKKLLRLWIMTKMSHSEDYVVGAMRSADLDIKNLTHQQIAVYKSTLKVIEADLMIEAAFSKEKPASVRDIDLSVFKPCTKTF